MNEEAIVRAGLEDDPDQLLPSSLDTPPALELDVSQLAAIVQTVPGGADNMQDIYPLSPLQEGMLFHRLLNADGDAYVLSILFELDSLSQIAALTESLQQVVNRHDVLRTAILWEQLPKPVQVVYRRATLATEPLHLDNDRDGVAQLAALLRPQKQRMELRRAPLLRWQVTDEPRDGKWYALLRVHHVVCDYRSLQAIVAEMMAFLEDREHELPIPVAYRNYVDRTQMGSGAAAAEAFFRRALASVDEPTAPFGLADVHGDGSRIDEARLVIDQELARSVRAQARSCGASAARLFHAAWALVVARTSGRDDVVFGTVLLDTRQRNARAPDMLGMSVNTLPLRLTLRGTTAQDLLAQTDDALSGLLLHEQTPLAVAQRCSGVGGTVPLFTALLNYRRSVQSSGALPSTTGVRVAGRGEAWTNYPITMIVEDRGDTFELIAQTDRAVSAERVAGYLSTAVRSLVEALGRASPAPALGLAVLPLGELHEVLRTFNATEASYPRDKLVHECFEQQVERTPYAVAAYCGNQFVTYRQLNSRANQLARYLRRHAAGSDRFVGLCVERDLDMVIGVLGILKSGSAYVPLDPAYPQQRLEYILSDTRPVAVVTKQSVSSKLPRKAPLIVLDAQRHEIEHEAATNLGRAPDVSDSSLAYVIYTSGSTGQPKGVAIEHRNAVNLICWAHDTLDAEMFEETLLSTSLNFDLSVYECFVPLACGGSVRVVENALSVVDAPGRVTLVNTVPSAIRAVMDSGRIPATTRVVNLAGEPLKQDVVERIFAESTVDLVCNLYGPSETTTYSTGVAMSRGDGFVPTIGRPLPNTQVYILDPRREPVPVGVIGEIYIGGAGVARGYLNRPELTAERFLPDPFNAEPTARLYKTGDLGRWRADGQIEYLGRNDHQVKIRGFRVELGEIETQLARHGHVAEAVVAVREDVPGDRKLVAYIVPACSEEAPAAEVLRAHLKVLLPEYMVPSAFVTLQSLPLTPNGKIDRKALPVPQLTSSATADYEAPQGELEELVAGIWQALLHVEQVGRNDNFFVLGGHSLLIVQMRERLHRLGLSIDVGRVFDTPTLRDLAGAITSAATEVIEPQSESIPAGCTHITPQMLPLVDLEDQHIELVAQRVPGGQANIQDIYPLVPLQEGILFHHLLDERRGDTYVLPTVLTVSSRERLNEFAVALQAIVDRHDVLRTGIFWEGLPRPVQVVQRRATLRLEIIEDGARDLPALLEEWLKPQQQRLDLSRAPLMRLQAVQDAAGGRWCMLLQLHHIISDGQSLRILVSETMAHLADRGAQLPPAIPYRNHVAHALAYARTSDPEGFFRDKLAAVDEPTAPFGILDVYGDGSRLAEDRRLIDAELALQLRRQASLLGVTAATLFHAAWALVVAHTSGRHDVVFGSVLLGRLQGAAGTQRIPGMFINTLPLRLQLRDVSARELVGCAQRELVALLAHEQASLAVAQRCSGIEETVPLFTALLNYRHRAATDSEWGSANGIQVLASQGFTNYPVTLSVDDLGDDFTLTAHTDRRIDPHRIAEYLNTALRSLLDALENRPGTPALTLPILPESERSRVLSTFNATHLPHSSDKVIHRLFEEQVAQTPHAVAAIYGDRALTYGELNAKANQLAAFLRSRNVGVGRIVGVCMERGLDVVIGLLGILKAGAAYLPLDPNYPVERLQYMMEDAAPIIVLTQRRLKGLLSTTRSELVMLDEEQGAVARSGPTDLSNPDAGATPRDLVYVIYTSGSTGRPKGTAMPHGAMVNLLEWHRRNLPVHERQRVLQFAALSFDVAFQETFSTLCGGGALVLVDEIVRKDPRALMALMCNERIERLFVPPVMLQALAEYDQQNADRGALLDVIVAGEQLRVSEQISAFFARRDGCRLHNHYGPTETHVVTALTLDGDPQQWPVFPTIGRPIANTQIYILDAQCQPVPIDVIGEIYIGGANVARGYVNRPELTAERFVPDPFAAPSQARLYRTGDLGRWRSDGTIAYLGRNDDQIKIRGFRVELGEIEAQLVRHPEVRAAAVVAHDVGAEKRIIGYVVQRGATAPSVEQLSSYLKAMVPEHMVPSAFVTLHALPLTPSGKLNRRALPPPGLAAYALDQYEPAQTETEQVLARLWKELLRLERVGRHDHFFRLGGNSMTSLRLLVKVADAFAAHLTATMIFQHPTLQEMAQLIDVLVSQTQQPRDDVELEEGTIGL